MVTRRVVWWCALITLLAGHAKALQYSPVPLTGVGDGDCALLLNGPGRSSAFDYSLNLLRGGGFGYNGQHTCITYDAVNSAYLEARKRVQVAQPHGDWKPEDVATVGELLLDISVNLARTYGLSYEDIEKGLPLIDTSKTLIREICPPFLSNVECRPGKYRRFDGLCTNLENPTWGATMQPFTRLIGPLYADGMTAPRISITGNQLPLARVVSRTMHPDEGYHDHAGTVMVIAWGQFIDHDYTLTATPLDPLNRNDPEECCKRPLHLKNPYCNEIIVPADDYFYRLFNVQCIDFVRGFPATRPGCRLGSRSQYNTLTGVLDANTVYGVTEKFARKLRTGYGGLMRMNSVFRDYGLKDLLPLKLDIPDEGCTRPNRTMFCFEAGEIRVNEQLVLTCMHTLMAREHNRIAEALAHINPHWDDETLFQEARRINIAEVQHITYNEFLPILLGKEVMQKFGLLLQKNGYWDGYDPSVNPNVIDAFAAAAYRFGHSLLPTAVERWSKAHKFIASKRLSDLIRRPYDLYRAGVFDEYFMGLMNQVAQAMDDSITQEVTNHLFKKAGARFGMDLVSFNMQRGREFGLPGYMEFRKFCGLPGAETFDELFGSMPNETIKKYATIFEHPSDVDLWSGGVSERPLPGSMLGPTFACIIATQFSYSRRGDRFWYELPNQPSSFTPEQLAEIRKARLARVICDNTDLIDTIQLYPMVLADHEINPRVPCRSRVLPSIDFSKWADPVGGTFHQSHQPFVKDDVDIQVEKVNLVPLEETNLVNPPTEQTTKNVPQINIKKPCPLLIKNQYWQRKNIKILPPLINKPQEVVTQQSDLHNRVKRNTDNHNNLTKNIYNKLININNTSLPTVNLLISPSITNQSNNISQARPVFDISKINKLIHTNTTDNIPNQNLQNPIHLVEQINEELLKDSKINSKNYEILDDDDEDDSEDKKTREMYDEEEEEITENNSKIKVDDDSDSVKINKVQNKEIDLLDRSLKLKDNNENNTFETGNQESGKLNEKNKEGTNYFYNLENIKERAANKDKNNQNLEDYTKDTGENVDYKTENNKGIKSDFQENIQNEENYDKITNHKQNLQGEHVNINYDNNPVGHEINKENKSPYKYNERDNIFQYIHNFNKHSDDEKKQGIVNVDTEERNEENVNNNKSQENKSQIINLELNDGDEEKQHPEKSVLSTSEDFNINSNEKNGRKEDENVSDKQAEITKPEDFKSAPNHPVTQHLNSDTKLNQRENLEEQGEKQSELNEGNKDLEDPESRIEDKRNDSEAQITNGTQETEIDISEQFTKHFVNMDELDEIFGFAKPNAKKNANENSASFNANLQINGEKHTTPYSSTRSEKDEKTNQFSSYLDDILSKQFEFNEKLRSETVYPKEEDAYERQRKKALNDYGTHKDDDFTNANAPYEINLGSYFNNKDEDEEELDESEDVDTGTDKMKLKENDNNEPLEASIRSIKKNKKIPYFIDHHKLSTEKRFIYAPYVPLREETKENIDKEREELKIESNVEADDDIENLEDLENKVVKLKTNEQNNENKERRTENIEDVLKKILQKKDSISRHHDMDDDAPMKYQTFWTLEYKIPK